MALNESKNGTKYMSGKDEEGRKYFIFKNDKKGNEKAPDYTLSVEVDDEINRDSKNSYKVTNVEDVPF